MKHSAGPVVGVDTGGTFTDLVLTGPNGLRVHKLPSTPAAPDQAVVAGVRALLPLTRELLVQHGSTVGLNALLRRAFPPCGLLTSAGFRDVLEIGRQHRLDLYALAPTRPRPLVPRNLRVTVPSRAFADEGQPEERATAVELARAARVLRRAGVHSVAIGFLHSYRRPQLEHAAARVLRDAGLLTTCSADLLPEHREFERFSTAAINAALIPVMSRYLDALERALRPAGLLLMQSDGGLLGPARARQEPARLLFSGPAGGVTGARRVALAAGVDRTLAFDMGGTSTDVSFLSEQPNLTRHAQVDGLPVALPSVDVHSVGCGGGSLAFVDAGGSLRVGPQSAGADPGPACYGRSDQPTVTDAHVALGHIGQDGLLGGRFPIDPALSARAIERLARRLGVTPRRAAEGILLVAEVAMERAHKVMSLERGEDPRELTLLPFGGAAGLHAVRLARRLGIRRILVPPVPGALSALGLALAVPAVERSQPVFRPLAEWPAREQQRAAAALTRAVTAALRREHAARSRMAVQVALDLRYAGQSFELRLTQGPRLAARFHALHQRVFGFARTDAAVECVQLRVRAELATAPLQELRAQEPAPTGGVADRRGTRVWRADLRPGQRVRGPALLREYSSTLFLPRGSTARSDASGTLWVEP